MDMKPFLRILSADILCSVILGMMLCGASDMTLCCAGMILCILVLCMLARNDLF
jgi:hypothetical protein